MNQKRGNGGVLSSKWLSVPDILFWKRDTRNLILEFHATASGAASC